MSNFGRTPGRVETVVDGVLTLPANEQFPEIPDYARGETVYGPAFLVHGDYINVAVSGQLERNEVTQLKNRQRKFLVYGHVDYIDQFGKSYRAGYGREYRPDLNVETNLTYFFSQHAAAYNYDEERKREKSNGKRA